MLYHIIEHVGDQEGEAFFPRSHSRGLQSHGLQLAYSPIFQPVVVARNEGYSHVA